MLGLRQVNLGQYLAGGDALVTLQSLNPIYVNFGVPQQSVGQVPVGRVGQGDDRRRRQAPIGRDESPRIDSRVDEATRNIQVQATLANPDGKLGPGMFVQTEVVLGPRQQVVALPASADQLRAVRRFGVRRHRAQGRGRQAVSRRAAAVRQARTGTRRPGGDSVRREAGR